MGGEFVTDVVSDSSTAATTVIDDAAVTDATPPQDGDRPVEWAPAEPAPKRRRGLWIGLGVGAVVIGGAGDEFSYEALNRAFNLVLNGASLIAMHRGLSWRTSAGMQLDTGAFLTGLERASGVEATVIGKPEPAMFAAGLANLGVAPSEAVMIGDDIDADVRGAQAAGLTGVLVRTGKFRAQVLDSPGAAPDLVTDSIVSALAALGY